MHDARENARKCQDEGASTKDRLSKFVKLSARNLVKAGTNRLGKDAFDLVKEYRVERPRVEKERPDAVHSELQAVLDAASEFIATQNPDNDWTVANFKTALKSLRRDETEKIPKKKNDLVQLCKL